MEELELVWVMLGVTLIGYLFSFTPVGCCP
jgi:hypothetical protein